MPMGHTVYSRSDFQAQRNPISLSAVRAARSRQKQRNDVDRFKPRISTTLIHGDESTDRDTRAVHCNVPLRHGDIPRAVGGSIINPPAISRVFGIGIFAQVRAERGKCTCAQWRTSKSSRYSRDILPDRVRNESSGGSRHISRSSRTLRDSKAPSIHTHRVILTMRLNVTTLKETQREKEQRLNASPLLAVGFTKTVSNYL